MLFAFLSVIALAATGFAAYYLIRRPSALVVAPLVLAISGYFFEMSWTYLNVDIVGTCFVMLGLAAVMKSVTRPGLWRLAVVPAACAGLAAGSKYPYGLLLLSVILAVWLYMEPKRRIGATAAAIGAALVSFLTVVPYGGPV